MRPENRHMKQLLDHYGIKASVQYIRNGSMRGTWYISLLDGEATPDLIKVLTQVGLTERRGGQLSEGNIGKSSFYLCGLAELLISPPVLEGPRSEQLLAAHGDLCSLETPDTLEAAYWTIENARRLWQRKCEEYLKKNGEQGANVVGAGIGVQYLGPRRRLYRPKMIISASTVVSSYCNLVWEDSVDEVVNFLQQNGLPSAHYIGGRMD